MAYELVIPRLGLTMETGQVVRWYKQDGETVAVGEPVFAVESDKAVVDAEAPVAGAVYRRAGLPDKPLPIGTVVGYIVAPGEPLPADMAGAPSQPTVSTPDASAPGEKRNEVAAVPPRRAHALSPAARRRAQELGLDWRELDSRGEQPLHVADVLAASRTRISHPAVTQPGSQAATEAPVIPPAQVTPAIVERVKPIGLERRTGSAAPVTLWQEADATELIKLQEQLRIALGSTSGPVPTLTDLIIRLCASALVDHPMLNAWRQETEAVLFREVHVGVTVQAPTGASTPVIHHVNGKGLLQIAKESHALADRALAGQLAPEDLEGGTFTVVDLGAYDVDAFTPLLSGPQCAALGIGRIVQKPRISEGSVTVGYVLTLSLTVDHCVVDGAPAARFLAALCQRIREPYPHLLL